MRGALLLCQENLPEPALPLAPSLSLLAPALPTALGSPAVPTDLSLTSEHEAGTLKEVLKIPISDCSSLWTALSFLCFHGNAAQENPGFSPL